MYTDFYHYSGGLTTPTCDEIVTWMVMKERYKINATQLAYMTSLWAGNAGFAGGAGTNRAVQALNGRTVYRLHRTPEPAYKHDAAFLISMLALFSVAGLGFIVSFCDTKKGGYQKI